MNTPDSIDIKEVTRNARKTLALILQVCKEILSSKGCECGDPEHRVQPRNYQDWYAIDFHMAQLSDYLYHEVDRHMVSGFRTLLREVGYSALEKYEKSEYYETSITVKAVSLIMMYHHEIVAKWQRGNNADIHYARILNMVEQHIGMMDRKLDNPANVEAVLNTMGLNREKNKHFSVPKGETVQ